MKNKRIIAIIQARTGSTRLPGKVLMDLQGKTLIEHVVERVSRAKSIFKVIVATSDTAKDDQLAGLLKRKKIAVFRGDESDVLKRYYLAAKKYKADLIVRVCGDQPLADPEAIEATLAHCQGNDFTYCKHQQGWPDGSGCEVITFKALEKAHLNSTNPFEREHIQPYFLHRQDSLKVRLVDAPPEIQCQKLHLAVDTPEDFARISQMYTNFYQDSFVSLKSVVTQFRKENSKKIVLISNFTNFLKEATNITVLELAKELQKRGHDVSLVTAAGKEEKDYEIEGVKVYARGFKGKASLYNPQYWWHQINTPAKIVKNFDDKPTIIHHFSSSPGLVLRALKAKGKSRLVHTMKSISLKSKFQQFKLLNLCDAITVPTQIMKEMLLEKGIKEEKIKIIRTNINLDKFKPIRVVKCKREKIIFYYGALRQEKGIPALVQALPLVLQNHPDVKLVIGSRARVADRLDGKNIKEIKETLRNDLKVNELGLANHVEILLGDIDIVHHLNSAQMVVFAYPTLDGTEGNPSCLLESMACKVPIVTTDLPPIREILSSEEAVLVKPNDQEDLVKGINRLLDDPKLGRKLSQKAFLKVKEFDVKKIADEFLEIYEVEKI